MRPRLRTDGSLRIRAQRRSFESCGPDLSFEPHRRITTRGGRMKYMLQVRFNGADAVIGGLPAPEQEKITAEFQAIRRTSGVLDANQLEAPGTATTVRGSDGQTGTTDV